MSDVHPAGAPEDGPPKSSAVSEAEIAKLREGLRREREIYEVLTDMVRRQEEILRGGGTDEILRLARQKELELGRIQEIENGIATLKKEWPRLRESTPNPLRGEVENELAQIEEVLRKLIEMEASSQRGIESFRRETTDKLRKVEGGRRIRQAYGGSSSSQARYLDKVE